MNYITKIRNSSPKLTLDLEITSIPRWIYKIHPTLGHDFHCLNHLANEWNWITLAKTLRKIRARKAEAKSLRSGIIWRHWRPSVKHEEESSVRYWAATTKDKRWVLTRRLKTLKDKRNLRREISISERRFQRKHKISTIN